MCDTGSLKPEGRFSYLAESKPKTPTPLVVPTYTFPLAIIGVMNLFPLPK